MKDFENQDPPPELRGIVSRLRAERAQADPLHLDQIKQRAMRRAQRPLVRTGFMRSRLATICTLFALVGGTGGALAVAGTSSGGAAHSASSAEYKPGKGCGDKNHKHTGSKGKQKPCPTKGHKGGKGSKHHKSSKGSKHHKSAKGSKHHKSSKGAKHHKSSSKGAKGHK
jgi:hypothetical protein